MQGHDFASEFAMDVVFTTPIPDFGVKGMCNY